MPAPLSLQALMLSLPQEFTDVLQPFCNGPKSEVALINTVQVYCYEDTRIMKAFPQILKVTTTVDNAGRVTDDGGRCCTIRTVSLTKPLFIGTRRVRSRRASSTFCRRLRHSLRYYAPVFA